MMRKSYMTWFMGTRGIAHRESDVWFPRRETLVAMEALSDSPCSVHSGPYLKQLADIVHQRDQRPFSSHVLQATQQEPLESPGRFDLSQHWLDDPFVPAV